MLYFRQAVDSARQGNPEFRLEIFSGQADTSLSGFQQKNSALGPASRMPASQRSGFNPTGRSYYQYRGNSNIGLPVFLHRRPTDNLSRSDAIKCRQVRLSSTLSDCPPSHLMLSCDKMQPVVLNEFTEVLNFHDGLNIPNAFPDWSSRHSPTLKTTSAPICPVFNAGPARSKTPPNATSMACFSVTAATWNKWLNRWRAATISAFTTC
jgi:hypothetical protein